MVKDKLAARCRCLYLNSPPMVAGIRSYLSAADIDVASAVSQGDLILSSANDHLLDGRFDVDRMIGMLGEALDQALRAGYAGLWATGDMTWEFGNERNFTKLMEYECALEEFFQNHPELSGICQYHTDTLPLEAIHPALAAHRGICINQTLTRVNPYYVASDCLAAQYSIPSAGQLRARLDSLR